MLDLFTRVWHNLIERTEGPMYFRFFIQPIMSLIFALRAAWKDAKTGTTPYLWRFRSMKDDRKTIAREAWKDVGKVFLIAVILDIIYQLIVIFGEKKLEERFYPLESIIVAILLAIVPYILFRGPLNRVLRIFVNKFINNKQ